MRVAWVGSTTNPNGLGLRVYTLPNQPGLASRVGPRSARPWLGGFSPSSSQTDKIKYRESNHNRHYGVASLAPVAEKLTMLREQRDTGTTASVAWSLALHAESKPALWHVVAARIWARSGHRGFLSKVALRRWASKRPHYWRTRETFWRWLLPA